MHYFIVAGEASGDLHASQLMRELRMRDPQARFTFLGGDLMAAEAGHGPLIHYRDMAFMGFSEVLRNLRTISRNMTAARKAMLSCDADCFIAVDYPSFNLKLAKAARRHGMPVFYYISPKVWAWKSWRVKQLRRYVKRVLSILPFEMDYFSGKGVTVSYVGNPSMEEVDRRMTHDISATELRRCAGVPEGKPLLALVPGSRRGEIRNNLPIMDAVARMHPEMEAVVAGAPGIEREFYNAYTGLPVAEGITFSLMHHADAALVTSGTATLECALTGTPQVVCYRANGSRVSYWLMSRLVKCPFVSLPNLIAGRGVIPEMLLHRCTVESVDGELRRILPGTKGREEQLEGYALMRSRLGASPAAPTAAQLIINDLKQ